MLWARRLLGLPSVVSHAVVILGMLVGTAWPRQAPAAPLARTDAEVPQSHELAVGPVVEVRVVGVQQSLAQLRATIGNKTFGVSSLLWFRTDTFAPQQLLDLVPLAKVKIRCWIDLTDPNMAHLYFVAPKHDRFMVRELALMGRFGSFELESLAQIIELSVEVLLNDAEAGMSRKEAAEAFTREYQGTKFPPSPPETQPAARATAREGLHFGVQTTYALSRYSREIPLQHGPGIGPLLSRRHGTRREQVGLTIRYDLPTRVEHPVAAAEIDRLELRLGAAAQWALLGSSKYYLGPELNLALGFVGARAIPGELSGSYHLYQHSRPLEALASLGVRLSADLAAHIGADIALETQWVPSPVRHALKVDGATEELTTGNRFRIGLSLGLRIE